jgi:cation transport ATPase
VTAGTVNYEGVLTIEAASTGQDSTLAGIAALVAEAQVTSETSQSCALQQDHGRLCLSWLCTTGLLGNNSLCCDSLSRSQSFNVRLSQGREAPVQRLADSVAGRFCYTVMAASAITFSFWYLFGEATTGSMASQRPKTPFCVC